MHQGHILLSQRQYILDILTRHGISDCKPCSTPVDTCAKVSADAGPPVADPTVYRSLAGALHLTFTRPDIAYVVQQVCLYMHDPWEVHLVVAKRILWYLQGTIGYGLLIPWSAPTQLIVCIDVDWAGYPTPAAPPQGTLSSSVAALSLGYPSGNPRSLGPVPRPNTMSSPTKSPKSCGCSSYFRSFTTP